ncbi:MAG TPA: hypothetical protein PKW29_12095, partial [Clostridia bacterium]|nr:hypothetical protein [Clostridia bacterium]
MNDAHRCVASVYPAAGGSVFSGCAGGSSGGAIIPIPDFAIYYLLASEIARMAVTDGGPELTLFVDAQTAAQVDA